jgi:hypothetical protein
VYKLQKYNECSHNNRIENLPQVFGGASTFSWRRRITSPQQLDRSPAGIEGRSEAAHTAPKKKKLRIRSLHVHVCICIEFGRNKAHIIIFFSC